MALPLALFLFAFALRLYRLHAVPLWLDELFETQLGRLGLAAILRNSLWESAPPLSALVFWLGSGLGAARAEWAWRWPVVLAGAGAVPLVFAVGRRLAGVGAGVLAALLLAVSPTALFYSQEARSYGLALGLAALSLWSLLTPRLTAPRRWWLWAGVSVAGCWTNYAYGLVVLSQALYAVPRAWREPGGRAALLAAAGGAVGAGALAAVTLPTRAAAVAGPTLDLPALWYSLLAGDVLRYGRHADQPWLIGALAGLALLGGWHLWRRGQRMALLLCAGQVVLPLVLFFGLARPLLGVELEAYQSRQFVALLPALFVLVGVGGGWLGQGVAARLGRRAALSLGLVLTAALLAGSLTGVRRYWAQTKSPEGLAARYLAEHVQPGHTIVSLSYSVDAALGFYGPDEAVIFTRPLAEADGVAFSDSLSVLLWDWATLQRPYTLEDVAQYPDRWLVWSPGDQEALAARLVAGCSLRSETDFGPFRVAQVEHCPPIAATPTAP